MSLNNFFREVKRRNVYKVAITYGIVAWLLAQVAGLGASSFGAPDWVMKMILLVLIIGFPVALVLAWAFEMSPQGIVRITAETSNENPFPSQKKKSLTSNIIIGILLLAVVGLSYSKFWRANKGVDESIAQSVAVLPFKNMSSNLENQFFCDGVMDAILTHLARIEELSVPSRTTMEKYKDSPLNMRQISEELGVSHLLEGSVQRDDNTVYIIVKLIHGTTDREIWVDEYQRELKGLFAVQSEVAKTIANKLKVNILPETKDIIETVPTTNMASYDYYLKGEALTLKSYKELDHDAAATIRDSALQMYNNALELDATFALPYAGLANIYFMKANTAGTTRNQNMFDTVLYLCNRGISIDDNHPMLFWIRGRYYEESGNLERAINEYENVLILHPRDVFTLQSLANIYRQKGSYVKAYELLKKALNSEGSILGRAKTYRALNRFYLSIGDLNNALESLENAMELDMDSEDVHYLFRTYWARKEFEKAKEVIINNFEENHLGYALWMGKYHLQKGEYAQAFHFTHLACQQIDTITWEWAWIMHGLALDKVGRTQEAKIIFNRQREILEDKTAFTMDGWKFINIAGIYSYFGDNEKAMEYLRKTDFRGMEGINPIISTQTDPMLVYLTSHPEYIQFTEAKLQEFEAIRNEIKELEALGEL